MSVLMIFSALMLGFIFVFIPTKISNIALGQDNVGCLEMMIYPEPENATQMGFPFTNKLEFAGECGQSEYNKLFYDKVLYDFLIGAGIVLVPGLYYINKRSKKQQ